MGIKKRLLIQNLSIITLSILLFLGILISGIYHYYYSGTAEILKNHAENSAQFSKRYMDLSPYTIRDQVQDIQTNFSLPQAETQVISTDGKMLSSSEGFISHGKLDFPDIQDAFRKGEGTWMGTNPETDEHVLAVSVPLESDGKTVALLRFVSSLEPLDDNFKTILATLIGIGLSILLMVFVISTFFSRMITDPVVELTSASQKLAKGDLEARMTGTYKDEFHTLSQSFNDMGQELLKTEKLKNEFISSVSHELRTPLTYIGGYTAVLMDKVHTDPDDAEESLKLIQKESIRMQKLINELLELNKLEDSSSHLEFEPIVLSELLSDTLSLVQPHAREKDLVLERSLDEETIINGDPDRIRQVVYNVLDNAIKYSKPQGKIILRSSRQGDEALITIRDHGIGIPSSSIPRIGERFYRSDLSRTRNSGGYGLGLSIAKEILHRHGGSLQIESEEGSGTTVTVRIPLLKL